VTSPRCFAPRAVSSEAQRQAYVEVIRGYAQGRVLHFNGAVAALISFDGQFMVMADVMDGKVERVELSQCEQSRRYVETMRKAVAVMDERPSGQRRSDLDQAQYLQAFWGVPDVALAEVVRGS